MAITCWSSWWSWQKKIKQIYRYTYSLQFHLNLVDLQSHHAIMDMNMDFAINFRIQWVNTCNDFQHHSDASCTTSLWPKLTKFILWEYARLMRNWVIRLSEIRPKPDSEPAWCLSSIYLQEDLLKYSLLGRKWSMMHLKNIQCIHKQINTQVWQQTFSLIAQSVFSHGMRSQVH